MTAPGAELLELLTVCPEAGAAGPPKLTSPFEPMTMEAAAGSLAPCEGAARTMNAGVAWTVDVCVMVDVTTGVLMSV